jgi:phosphate binding protein
MKMKPEIRKKAVRGLAAVMIMTVAAVGFAGCGSGSASSSSGSSGGNADVVIAGSTSVQPLSEALAKTYMKDHSGVDIEVQGGGSGQAVKSLKSNIATIGALSRDLDDSEKGSVSKTYTIAKDGVAVIVNSDVNVDDLTLAQLQKIYTGKITNWSKVGGDNAKIAVVSREEGSGTREAFTTKTGVLANDKDKTTKKAIVQSSTGAVNKTVKSTPDSIGYVSLASVSSDVKTVKVEGVSPSESTVLDGTYKIQRPFLYAVTDKANDATKAFIKYVLSDAGQKQVKKNGFIPVNKTEQ